MGKTYRLYRLSAYGQQGHGGESCNLHGRGMSSISSAQEPRPSLSQHQEYSSACKFPLYSLSSAKKFPRDIFWALDLAGAGGGKSSAVLNHHKCADQRGFAARNSTRPFDQRRKGGLHEPMIAVKRGQETRQRTRARFSHRRVWRKKRRGKKFGDTRGEVQEPCKVEENNQRVVPVKCQDNSPPWKSWSEGKSAIGTAPSGLS